MDKDHGEFCYYFAYGSNMCTKEFYSVVGWDFITVTPAQLEGYAIDFTLWSDRRKGYVADIVESQGSHVWGVLYRVSAAQMNKLDKKEGVAKGYYKRHAVRVLTLNGLVDATAYIVVNRENARKPSYEYMNLIIQGANEHCLPDEYVESLRTYVSSLR